MKAARVFAWMSLCMLGTCLAGPGCSLPDCPEGTVAIVDNRDRVYPERDQDWICLMGWPYNPSLPGEQPPPDVEPPPDVSEVSPPDPAGPKDPDAVVNAVIAHASCYESPYFRSVNRMIDLIYSARSANELTAALADRTACFKDMANGCETYRTCMGITTSASVPADVGPCKDGIAYSELYLPIGLGRHLWTNCAALGYECEPGQYFPEHGNCVYPNKKACDINAEPWKACIDGDYYRCWSDETSPTKGSAYDYPRCSDYGFECTTEANYYFHYCKGTGPACSYSVDPMTGSLIFDYRQGLSCESETVLRTCVGGGEHVIDCTSLSPTFKCLNPEGDQPARCGFARECSLEDEPMCDDTTLVVCDAGRVRKIDCRSLGFTSCNAERRNCDWKVVQ